MPIPPKQGDGTDAANEYLKDAEYLVHPVEDFLHVDDDKIIVISFPDVMTLPQNGSDLLTGGVYLGGAYCLDADSLDGTSPSASLPHYS